MIAESQMNPSRPTALCSIDIFIDIYRIDLQIFTDDYRIIEWRQSCLNPSRPSALCSIDIFIDIYRIDLQIFTDDYRIIEWRQSCLNPSRPTLLQCLQQFVSILQKILYNTLQKYFTEILYRKYFVQISLEIILEIPSVIDLQFINDSIVSSDTATKLF